MDVVEFILAILGGTSLLLLAGTGIVKLLGQEFKCYCCKYNDHG